MAQEFEMLNSFMRESGARAYDQALLLDVSAELPIVRFLAEKVYYQAKQTEVSDSLSDLSVEIASLAHTTREMNASMSDITARNFEYAGSAGARGLLLSVLDRLNLSAYLAIGIIALALPRLVLEFILRTFLCLTRCIFLLMVSADLRLTFFVCC